MKLIVVVLLSIVCFCWHWQLACQAIVRTGHYETVYEGDLSVEPLEVLLPQVVSSCMLRLVIFEKSDPVKFPFSDCSLPSCHGTWDTFPFVNASYHKWTHLQRFGYTLVSKTARLTVQLYDLTPTIPPTTTGKRNEVFIGGVSLTVEQLLHYGDNGKPIHLALFDVAGHRIDGRFDVNITYTATNKFVLIYD